MPKTVRSLLRSRLVRRALVTLGVLAALFVLLDGVIMPAYVRHGGTLTVPAVTDLPLAEAEAALRRAELEPVHAETRPDPARPEGVVVLQNPAGGSEVKAGRRVYLVVSGGEILVQVPALRGLSVRDARFRLERNGLVPGEQTSTASDTYFANTVVDQTLQAGARVPRGTPVGLVVSSGKSTDEIEIPDVTGRTLAEAEKLLTQAGLSVGLVNRQAHADLLPNTVIDQYPRAGEKAGPGRAVDLFVVDVTAPLEGEE